MPRINKEARVEKPVQVVDKFSCVLSNGRKVVFRTMVGRDLLFLESLKDSETKKTFKLMERLSIEDKITFAELCDLPASDFAKLAKVMAKASGVEDEVNDDDEDELYDTFLGAEPDDELEMI